MPINFDWFDLGPYANKHFVETGLFHGEGVLKALSSGYFEHAVSIEVNRDLVERALDRMRLFTATGMLKVVHDDSVNLGAHIKDIQNPITFFLDAHGSWVEERRQAPAASTDERGSKQLEREDDAAGAEVIAATACGDETSRPHKDPGAQNACPLMEELEAIRLHPLAAQHTILIDDRRCLQPDWEHPTHSWWRGMTESAVIAKLLEINASYRIEFIDGLVPGDIIAATPPSPAEGMHAEAEEAAALGTVP